MSWLFGIRKDQPQDFGLPDFPSPQGAAGGSSSDGKGDSSGKDDTGKTDRGKMDAYRFDSTALERAAKAAKELETSTHAREALELSKLQEKSHQMEHQRTIKELEVQIEQSKIEQTRAQQEERRKTIQEETKQHQQVLTLIVSIFIDKIFIYTFPESPISRPTGQKTLR